MNTRPHGHEGRHALYPILLPALAVAALVGASACGSAAPSPAQSLSVPASSVAGPASAAPAVAAGGDWIGFRGDASRSAVGLEGPTGNPILNWQFKAGGAVPNQIASVGDVVYFASDEGGFHAVNRVTGTEVWKQQLTYGTTTGATVADGL